MTKQSLTIVDVLRNETNRAVKALNYKLPANRLAVEATLETLQAIAQQTVPGHPINQSLNVRLIAVRNNLHANQIPSEVA